MESNRGTDYLKQGDQMHTKQINRYLLIYAFVIIALLLTNCSNINAPRLDAEGVWVEHDGTVYYHIEPGDSLSSIAEHTHVSIKILIDLNAQMLDKKLTIFAGQDLIIGAVE